MTPHPEARSVEKQIASRHPLRSLMLLDVLQDRESRPILIWSVGTLLFGMFVYRWLEGWGYLDSLYFCVISLPTVGYGDLAPPTAEAKVFTIFYVINGVGILLALFDRVRVVRTRRIDGDAIATEQQEGA